MTRATLQAFLAAIVSFAAFPGSTAHGSVCGTTQGACPAGEVCVHPTNDVCGDDNPGTCEPAAGRELRSFVFEGTVDDAFDGLGLYPDLMPGDRFRGWLTYDLTTPNTGGVGEGEYGVYAHVVPPGGVRMTLGGRRVRSVRGPTFTMFVTNDFGFAGADGFGFQSQIDLVPDPYAPDVLASALSWSLQEFATFGSPLNNVGLPACPVDLSAFPTNELHLRIDCLPCLGPAAFVDVTGTVDRFDVATRLTMDRAAMTWNAPSSANAFDVVGGRLSMLPDFTAAITGCMADDLQATSLAAGENPPPGEAYWYLVRPERPDGPGSWDSPGAGQVAQRDLGIEESGAGCP